MIKRKISDIIVDVPKFQRITDMNRVNDIFKNIKEKILTNKKVVLPGCVIFAKSPEKTWIIDGLHRMEVYKKLLFELSIDCEIFCNEIEVRDEEEARELFNIVNDTRVLPDMPEGIDVSKIKHIMSYLIDKYPNIFSNSKTGRVCRPNIHFNGLQEALSKVDKNITDNAIERIEALNNEVMTYGFSKYITNEDVNSLVETAKKKGKFYLGIIPNYKWVDIIFNEYTIGSYKKKAIPNRIRMEVWKLYIKGNRMEGNCYICNDNIKIDSFHCGHDIPECEGGQTVISNLRPICSSCNLSMGTRRIQEMKKYFN